MRTPLFAAAALLGLVFGQVSANASVRPASKATHVDASYIVAAGVPAAIYESSQPHPRFVAQGVPSAIYKSSRPHPQFVAQGVPSAVYQSSRPHPQFSGAQG